MIIFLPKILVTLHHADNLVNVNLIMDMLFVHAAKVTLEAHLLVDLNVLSVQIVHLTKHAAIKSALIHVWKLVVLTQTAKSLITAPFAVALQISLETHSFVALKKKVRQKSRYSHNQLKLYHFP